MKNFSKSNELFQRALKSIPLASQTFSKSHYAYVQNSPKFIDRGQGSHVWDVDGNEYIDFVSALLPVLLGYNYEPVNKAVIRQLESGTIFSLPHKLEIELAEKLISIIPCAEMVRFGKNGSDVTAGAVRLARAYTGRDRVAVCGYHGWLDWYIGSTTQCKGVPKAVRELTHPFIYNDISSLESFFNQYPGEFAAVIMEPMHYEEPKDDFLMKVRDLAHKNGAIFIFDEIVTGFHFDLGGAQKLFGVIPDLATFGKRMGNGFPISALVGKREIMELLDEVFFSFTFGGDTVSIAAALATISEVETKSVIEYLWGKGSKIKAEVESLIEKHALSDWIEIGGKPVFSILRFKGNRTYDANEIKSLWLQELIDRGILCLGSHNLTYSHSDKDIKRLLEAYDEVFGILKQAIENETVLQRIDGPPLHPRYSPRPL